MHLSSRQINYTLLEPVITMELVYPKSDAEIYIRLFIASKKENTNEYALLSYISIFLNTLKLERERTNVFHDPARFYKLIEEIPNFKQYINDHNSEAYKIYILDQFYLHTDLLRKSPNRSQEKLEIVENYIKTTSNV